MAILPLSPAPELFGDEWEDDALFEVRLRRITYSSGLTDALGDTPVSCLQWQTQKIRVLKAATLERLVSELTPVDGEVDPSFLIVFLSTYRAFTTTEHLLKILCTRVLTLLDSFSVSPAWEESAEERSHGIAVAPTNGLTSEGTYLPVPNGIELSPRTERRSSDSNTSCSSTAPSVGCVGGDGIVSDSERGSVLSDKDTGSVFTDRERHDVVRSLLAVFRLWLDQYPEDFSRPIQLSELGTMLERCHGHQDFEELQRFVNAMQHRKENVLMLQNRSSRLMFAASEVLKEEPGYRPKPHIDFLSIPAVVIARQLTLLDAELFYHVVPYHCLACVWSRRNKIDGGAPTVSATVDQFNRVCMLVTTTILKGIRDRRLESNADRPTQRACVLEHWLQIAQECRRLKNFSSLRAIVSSINSSSIERLSKTWSHVSKESVTLFEDLVTLTSYSDNDQIGRSLLMKEGTSKYSAAPLSVQKGRSSDSMSGVVQGVVPYLGTFLTDLTMIDSAHPDYVHGNLINFQKRRKEFEVLAQLTLFQKATSNYVLEVDSLIQSWIVSVDLLSEDASYRRSLELEPAKDKPLGKTSKMSRFMAFLSSKEKVSPLPKVTVSPPKTTSTLPRLRRSNSIPLFSDGQTVGITNSAFEINKKPSKVENSVFRDAYIIRVRLSKDFVDMPAGYKSFLLTNGDRARNVIHRVLEKNLIDGDPSDFALSQIISPTKEVRIPMDSNVYYALNTNTDQFNFILEKRSVSTDGPLQSKSSKLFVRSPSKPLLT